MSPENPSRYDELAALHAVDLLDDASRRELLDAAERDPAIEALVRDYVDTAALLAYEAPPVALPPELRQKILRQLPAPARAGKSNIIPFTQWVPYAIAACLMALGILESLQINGLKSELASSEKISQKLADSNALIGLHLATLEAKDTAYAASKILVAWDPYRHTGVVSLQNLPAAPTGKDYQLWVLDPGAEAPVSAGVVTDSRSFAVKPVSTPNPGFAISLEPAGGRPEPTGPILFAVAPGL
jgi:anti-sigma-K factor RskA